jgi:GR25 family glycosyltransferase involved in LPS biosynthesis
MTGLVKRMHGSAPDGMLQHVPSMELPSDADFSQALGLKLPVVVINLPHRTDRWEAVSGRMAEIGLDKLIKAPAVDGARLPATQIARLLESPVDDIDEAPHSHLTLTRPAIGCSLSHLAIWRWTIAANLPRVLVLEDDAAPPPQFDALVFRRIVTSLPDDAGLVFVGRIIMNGMADRAEGADLARLYYFNGTFAYLITLAACRHLLRNILPLRTHIDHQISSVLIEQRHVFPAWYTEPHFFEPDWSLRSDCYVPLAEETDADRELGHLLDSSRRLLLNEGRPLLAPFV